jgi:DNA-directed RNA polymerase specialized sigma24 family protein
VEIADLSRLTAGTPAATAFGEIRRLHGPAVHRFCLVVLGDSQAAEAAAQRVLRLAATAHALDRPDAARALLWLLGIACEAAIEARRRPPRRRRVTGASPQLGAALTVAAALPERELLAVALRSAAGLGYAEIGNLLSTSPESARMACGWALRRIREAAGTAG